MAELERVRERLNLYYEAEKAVLASQSYTIGGKNLVRANLAEIRAEIKALRAEESRILNNTRKKRTKRVVPWGF